MTLIERIAPEARRSRPRVTIEEVTDPAEVERIQTLHAQMQRNSDWLQAHWRDLLAEAGGRYLAVACQEAFVADTPEEAWALAKGSHPDDGGALLQYVPPEKGPRIYAHRR